MTVVARIIRERWTSCGDSYYEYTADDKNTYPVVEKLTFLAKRFKSVVVIDEQELVVDDKVFVHRNLKYEKPDEPGLATNYSYLPVADFLSDAEFASEEFFGEDESNPKENEYWLVEKAFTEKYYYKEFDTLEEFVDFCVDNVTEIQHSEFDWADIDLII